VNEVLVCVNESAKQRFEAKRAALAAAGKPTNEIWVFHGTASQQNIDSIISGGFRVGGVDGHAIANAAVHGNGVYTATGPATPMGGTYAGHTSQVILCRALPGQTGLFRKAVTWCYAQQTESLCVQHLFLAWTACTT
jgi:hypothetical protein